ncbi:MAG: hypothetical protein JWN52_1795 [Actinomycetia bacterium]|nr:hypothetical protein [Actinomycetes bacterium]
MKLVKRASVVGVSAIGLLGGIPAISSAAHAEASAAPTNSCSRWDNKTVPVPRSPSVKLRARSCVYAWGSGYRRGNIEVYWDPNGATKVPAKVMIGAWIIPSPGTSKLSEYNITSQVSYSITHHINGWWHVGYEVQVKKARGVKYQAHGYVSYDVKSDGKDAYWLFTKLTGAIS